MSNGIRTVLSVGVSLVLFSAIVTAQAGGNTAQKDQNKEHHSRLAKAAFWRHHKDTDKNGKQAQPKAPSKQAQAKTAQVKPVSAKQATGPKDQKKEQHASSVSKPSTTKKTPAANNTKQPQKAQDTKTDSSK